MSRLPTLDLGGRIKQKFLPTHLDPATMATAETASRDRKNHTGTQTVSTLSDWTKVFQQTLAANLVAGTGLVLSYDATGTGRITITATGGGTGGGGGTDPEIVRDVIGSAIVAGTLIQVLVNDAGDTITISTLATQNSTDPELRDRSTHTGTQPLTSVVGLTEALAARLSSVSGAKSQWAFPYTDPNVARPTNRLDVSITWVAVGTVTPPTNSFPDDFAFIAGTP